jgi:hypothetical protein
MTGNRECAPHPASIFREQFDRLRATGQAALNPARSMSFCDVPHRT